MSYTETMTEVLIGYDEEKIPIYDRGLDNIKLRISPDEAWIGLHGSLQYKYWMPGDKTEKTITQTAPIYPLEEQLQKSPVVLSIGAGGATAEYEIARKYPNTRVIAIDRAYPVKVKPIFHNQPNLTVMRLPWDDLRLPVAKVNTIIASESVGYYFRWGGKKSIKPIEELNRVSDVGTVLRATQHAIDPQTYSRRMQPTFGEILAAHGWMVFRPDEHTDDLFMRKMLVAVKIR